MNKIIRLFKLMKNYELYSATICFFIFSIITATISEDENIAFDYYILILISIVSTILAGLFIGETISRLFKK